MLTCLRREKAFLSRTKGKEGTPLSEGLQVAPTHAWAAELGEAVCMRGLLLHTWEQLPEKATQMFFCQPSKPEGEGGSKQEGWEEGPAAPLCWEGGISSWNNLLPHSSWTG